MKRIIHLTSVFVLFSMLVAIVWSSATAQDVSVPSQAASATLLFVRPGGGGGCTSWVDACELQAALAAASSGSEIWVQAGVYKPTVGADRTISFALKSGVALYGGFTGSENERAQRNWATNVTTLSGDIGVVGDISDNSYHVVSGSGVDATAVLDGFTVTGGNANGGTTNDYGGGIYINASSPTIANIIAKNNSAAYGGGMFNTISSPTLTNVTFSANQAGSRGGGVYSYQSNFTLEKITFSGNTTGDSG